MFCSNCGKPLRENSRFCDNCGVPVPQATAPEPPASAADPQWGSMVDSSAYHGYDLWDDDPTLGARPGPRRPRDPQRPPFEPRTAQRQADRASDQQSVAVYTPAPKLIEPEVVTVSEPEPVRKEPEKPEKKKKTGLIIGLAAGGLALLLALGALYWFVLKKPKVESIKLDATSLELDCEEEITVKAKIKPEEALEYNNVIWLSSDNSVAVVDQDGNIKAVGGGECVITVKAGDVSKDISVKVSYLNADEKLIQGSWDANDYYYNGEFAADLSSLGWKLVLNDDKTGRFIRTDDTDEIKWWFVEVDKDGDRCYKISLEDNGKTFMLYFFEEYDDLMLKLTGDGEIADIYFNRH